MNRFRPVVGLLSVACPAALAGALVMCTGAPHPAGEDFLNPSPPDDLELLDLGRKDGEFGLWVRFDGDSLRASWIVREEGPGFFEAEAEGGQTLRHVTTPDGFAHSAAVGRPGGDVVLLRYGNADDPEDRHETRIRLDTGEQRAPVSVTGVDSLYAIADIHGEYDNMVAVLRNAGLIDEDLRWSGGTAHLAVLGDMMSRGDDVTAVLWFIYRLEREARDAGGRVHVVLGNHEFMVMLDDHRYVQEKEFRIAEMHGVPYDRMFDPRHSVLGRWLTSKPVAMRVDDALMAHGGVSAEYLDYSLESLDDSVAVWVGEEMFYRWADQTFWDNPNLVLPVDSLGWERRLDFFWEPASPIWYREYALTDAAGEELDSVLRHFEARIHVVGHTPVEAIHQRYGGRLVLVNTFPFAKEVLLIVRSQDQGSEAGYRRYRIGFEGPPTLLQTLF